MVERVHSSWWCCSCRSCGGGGGGGADVAVNSSDGILMAVAAMGWGIPLGLPKLKATVGQSTFTQNPQRDRSDVVDDAVEEQQCVCVGVILHANKISVEGKEKKSGRGRQRNPKASVDVGRRHSFDLLFLRVSSLCRMGCLYASP